MELASAYRGRIREGGLTHARQQGLSHQNHRSRRQGARQGYRRALTTSLSKWSPRTASSGSTVSRTKASSPSPNSVSRASSNCSKSIENKNPANADPHPQAPSQGPTPEGYISVDAGTASIINRTCFTDGQALYRRAVATLERLSGELKYSASASLIRDRQPCSWESHTKKAFNAANVE